MAENPKDTDDLALFEARRAVAAARFSQTKTDAAINSAKHSSAGIRTLVQKNGFVEKFRTAIGGAA